MRETTTKEGVADKPHSQREPFPARSGWPLALDNSQSPTFRLGHGSGSSGGTSPPVLQAKLTINEPGDQYEQEADRVAQYVMRMPAPALQRKCGCAGSTASGAACEECGNHSPQLQRSTIPGVGSSTARASTVVNDVLRSPGQALDESTRAFFENRFHHDFSSVRVHTDQRAVESAKAVNALAYTVGRDIVFGAGEYAPASPAGKQLIAHELTHVLQQKNGHVSGRPSGAKASPSISSGAGPTIQRQAGRPARPAVSRGAPVVEDGQPLAAGQMHRSEFLAALRHELIEGCDAELAQFGRTARGCPIILRTIERYASRSIASGMRFMQLFGRPSAGTDARGLINAVTRRARFVTRRLGERYGQRAQAKTEHSDATLPFHNPVAIRAQLGVGRALDASARERMERSFNADFANVRVHSDSTAARLSAGLGARAFTIGNDIAFAAGEFRPGTFSGDTLIAHELAHTIQQGAATPQAAKGHDHKGLERQADHAAANAVAGQDLGGAGSLGGEQTGIRVQRWPAVVAGAITVAEVAPEAAVIAEVTAVTTTEVVVVEGALVVAADVALPVVAESVVVPAVAEGVAVEALAPAAIEAASATSAVSTGATAVGVASLTTISSDSPTTEQESNPQRRCQEQFGYPPCFDMRTPQEVASSFAASQGIAVYVAACQGISTFATGVFDCGGRPGENWHCAINNSGFVVSLFGCFCCDLSGNRGYNWHVHGSSGPGESDRGRMRHDTRRERREQQERERRRRERRDRDE